MTNIKTNDVMCEQNCGSVAEVYSGDSIANGWAGKYCVSCSDKLGFAVWAKLENK